MVTLEEIKKYYWACHNCITKAGGVYPEGHICTVLAGKCKICGKNATLIPWVDYDWKNKEDDIIAKLTRD